MITLQDMAALTALYNSPDRHYHNMRHINRCLGYAENLTGINLESKSALNAAICFHDAIYNPYSKYNEHYSAILFSHSDHWKEMYKIYRDNNAAQDAYHMIIATKDHSIDQDFNMIPDNSRRLAIQYMLDIDLAGLGDSYNQYEESARNIRKEYYNSTIEEFVDGRANFLESMLARGSIYYTDKFKHLENNARENMLTELGHLKHYSINGLRNYYENN